jgi:hypothetical protein
MLSKIVLAVAALVVIVLASGFGYLAFADVPAPIVKVHKVLPDARFPS